MSARGDTLEERHNRKILIKKRISFDEKQNQSKIADLAFCFDRDNSYQGVIFIVDHRFYRAPRYICCENGRKRSIVICTEIVF
jgi:hypothetical protein